MANGRTSKGMFEFLDHTADIKFKAYGSNLNEMFENVVLAVASFITGNDEIKLEKKKIIKIKGTDIESLLYKFVEELLYLIDAENFLSAKAKVVIKGASLRAELYGDRASKYKPDQIKAATYAEMYVKNKGSIWECQMVLDV